MRTLLCAFLALLLPARGKRRAAPAAPAPRPFTPRVTPVPLMPEPAPLNGHEMALVRPYVIAWELAQERRRQRERRRAAVPAPLGQDYPAEVPA